MFKMINNIIMRFISLFLHSTSRHKSFHTQKKKKKEKKKKEKEKKKKEKEKKG